MLGALGVKAAMLTGDGGAAAAGVGAAVGIPAPRVHARLLPAEKLDKVGLGCPTRGRRRRRGGGRRKQAGGAE